MDGAIRIEVDLATPGCLVSRGGRRGNGKVCLNPRGRRRRVTMARRLISRITAQSLTIHIRDHVVIVK